MEHAKRMDVYKNNNGVVMAQLAEPGEGMKELVCFSLVHVIGPFLLQPQEIK
jgi:hypothetical protein